VTAALRAVMAAGVCVAAVCGLAVSASALPVPIGRYVEVPFGISLAHPWVTDAGDAQRSGRARYPAPRGAPTLTWEARVGVGTAPAPAVTEGGTLYVSTSTGVASLDDAGEVRWSERVRFARGGPSLLPGGGALVVTRGGQILHFSEGGHMAGEAEVGAAVATPPLVLSDGSAVVGTRDMAVVRVGPQGHRRFRVGLSHVPTRPMAWDGVDRLAVAAGPSLLLLSTDGRLRARASLSEPAAAGPLFAADGTVWVVAADGQLSAFGPQGRVRARVEVGPVATQDGMAVGPDGAIRVSTRDGGLVCVGPSGTERWRLETEGVFMGGLSVDPNDVTLGVTAEGVLVAIEPDGTVRWRVTTHPRTTSHPVIHRDGTVFLGTSAGTVQAWR
jgi:outer membrane protein assembly factor BamB